MIRLFSCRLAVRHYWHEMPVKNKVISHAARQSLANLRKGFEKHHARIESGILPYVPEPGESGYLQWLKCFEKAAKVIGQASRGR
ncbi:MAG: hypothetical protein HW387_1196 [Parachlamydiales bacterium]|nr:hypothetical protein [Parachlamydiales bacterium]